MYRFTLILAHDCLAYYADVYRIIAAFLICSPVWSEGLHHALQERGRAAE